MGEVFLLAFGLEDDHLGLMCEVPDELLDRNWSRNSPGSQTARQTVRNRAGAQAIVNVTSETPIPPRCLTILATEPEPQNFGVVM